jgi:hypothetical protein
MACITIARSQDRKNRGMWHADVLMLTRRDTEALNTVATDKQALLRHASDNTNAL